MTFAHTQRGLVVNLGNTKVLIFHTSAWVWTTCYLTFSSHRPVEVVGSYIYLGVTFNPHLGKVLITHASKDRLTRGYASLLLLETQCHQTYFQNPRTKRWLFNLLVTPFLMNASMIWALGLPPSMGTNRKTIGVMHHAITSFYRVELKEDKNKNAK